MTEQPDDIAEQIGTDPDVDVTGEASDQESYHGYSVDDETQPQGSGDSLVGDRGLEEPLDEGYSPPEKWSAAQRYGNTPLEEELGETLDQRTAQEIPEPDPYEAAEQDVENVGGEVGSQRAGRLVAEDEGSSLDPEDNLSPDGLDRASDLEADDVGIDGAGASAEEAAVHVIEE
jgi:uncharacterized protein DUF5709